MLAGALACVSSPDLSSFGASGVWGYVSLVPHAGLETAAHGGGAYADRRVAGARRVDYDRPGFSVVYLDRAGSTKTTNLRLVEGLGGLRYEPPYAAARVGGSLRVSNETDFERALSAPAAGWLGVLAPGESADLAMPATGLLELFAPGAAEARASVFVVPGAFATVDLHGRYELVDVPPGHYRLAVWHPRFPPTARDVELRVGLVERVDLSLGVGLEESRSSHAAP